MFISKQVKAFHICCLEGVPKVKREGMGSGYNFVSVFWGVKLVKNMFALFLWRQCGHRGCGAKPR